MSFVTDWMKFCQCEWHLSVHLAHFDDLPKNHLEIYPRITLTFHMQNLSRLRSTRSMSVLMMPWRYQGLGSLYRCSLTRKGNPIVELRWSWNCLNTMRPGNYLNIKMSSYQHRIPIIKIRCSHDHLILNTFLMENSIPWNTVFILKWGPGQQGHNWFS